MNRAASATLQYYVPGIYNLVIDAILLAFLFGVLTMLSMVSVAHLVRRGIKQRSTAFMLGGVLLLYISTTVHLGVMIAHSVGCIRLVNEAAASHLSDTSFSDSTLVNFRRVARSRSFVVSAALATNVAIGDVIVWWRAFALWRTRSVFVLGTTLLVVTPAFGIVSMIHGGGGQIYIYIPLPPRIRIDHSDVYGAVSGILSLLTNTTATSLIALRAWKHRKILRQGLGHSKRSWMTPTMKTLLLLVESGTVYCVILVVAVAYNMMSSSPSGMASSPEFTSVTKIFLGGCLVPILAIYPTFIIFIVAIERSIIEDSLVNAGQIAFPSGALDILPDAAFAERGSDTTNISMGTLCFSIESSSDRTENVSTSNI